MTCAPELRTPLTTRLQAGKRSQTEVFYPMDDAPSMIKRCCVGAHRSLPRCCHGQLIKSGQKYRHSAFRPCKISLGRACKLAPCLPRLQIEELKLALCDCFAGPSPGFKPEVGFSLYIVCNCLLCTQRLCRKSHPAGCLHLVPASSVISPCEKLSESSQQSTGTRLRSF